MSSVSNMRDSIERYGGNREDKNKLNKRYYHKYFEGYTEFLVPKKNGRGTKILRIYTDKYYSLPLKKECAFALGLAYVLLFVLSACLFFSASLAEIAGNCTWYSAFFQVIVFVMEAWVMLCLFNRLTRPEEMTAYVYKVTSVQLMDAAGYAVLAMGGMLLCYAVSLLFGSEVGATLVCMLKTAFSAAAIYAVRFVEKRQNYIRVENNYYIPDNAVQC